MSATVVEVQDQSSVYHAAYVRDLKAGQVLVHYPNGWKADEFVNLKNVRIVSQFDSESFDPQEGDEVEVMAKFEESEPFGWLKASIKKVQGQLYLVDFGGFDEQVSKEMIRPLNRSPCLSNQLKKQLVPIPESLVQLMNEIKDSDSQFESYAEVQNKSGVLSLIEDFKNQNVIIIGTKSQIVNCCRLLDLHFLHREQLLQLEKQTDLQSVPQKQTKKTKDGIIEEFDIKSEYVSAAIGKSGSNIKKAQKIEGVDNINVEDNHITIEAKTIEAATQARQILEFVEKKYYLKNPIGLFVGKNFEFLSLIRQNSDVLRLQIPRNEKETQAAEPVKKGKGNKKAARIAEEKKQSNKEEKHDGEIETPYVVVVGRNDDIETAFALLREQDDFVSQILEMRKKLNSIKDKIGHNRNAFGIHPASNGKPKKEKQEKKETEVSED